MRGGASFPGSQSNYQSRRQPCRATNAVGVNSRHIRGSLLLVKFIFKNLCTLHFDKSYNLSQVYWKILVAVQSLSRVQLFAAPWTAARQASLSITISWSLLRLMSIESVMPSNHLILCHLLLLLPSIFPSIKGSFPMSQLFISGGQSIGDPALASVLPMNIHGWLPPGLTSLISL